MDLVEGGLVAMAKVAEEQEAGWGGAEKVEVIQVAVRVAAGMAASVVVPRAAEAQ